MTMSVTPVVAVLGEVDVDALNGTRNASEVAEVFAVPLAELRDPARRTLETRRGFSMSRFHVKPYEIWGLTGIVTQGVLQACFE